MTVDNHEKICAFLHEEDDGDTFWYTELLDRSVAGSSNKMRTLRVFYHRSQDQFALQWNTIKELCDRNGTRAYTRLSPRSFREVGKAFTTLVVQSAMLEHWDAMHRLYASACGRTPIHGRKLWLYDVDLAGEEVPPEVKEVEELLLDRALLVTKVPSRAGYHLVVKPHQINYPLAGITVHKDNPTNLYIPACAR